MLLQKRISIFLMIIIFIYATCSGSIAQVSAPEMIRAGLYFESSAVSSFRASAANGLQIGFSQGNNFVQLYDEATPNYVTIMKDSYFANGSSGIKEYDPASSVIPDGNKTGPYHIQIGEGYSDLNSLMQQLQAIRQAGIPAYPAYADSWQIWTGFYTNANSAADGLADSIQPILGDVSYYIIQPSARRIIIQNSSGETAFIYGGSQGALRIQPKPGNNPGILKVNSKNYRGFIEVKRQTGSDMTVINILKFEEYLYGVVPGEIESYSNAEALKAQAVAARTYALGNVGRHGKLGFDICNNTHCQMYLGFDKERPSTNKAVDDTKGLKVTYKGKLAQVFYFSSSGGYTESVLNVWGSDIPYLVSVPDKYESGTSANYNWQKILTAAKIKEIMDSRKYNLGDIISVEVTSVSPAGSALELRIKGTAGEKIYKKDECRGAFSFNSQKYSITSDADISIRGAGESKSTIRAAGRKVMTADGIKTISTSNAGLKILGADNTSKTVPAVPTTYIFGGRGYGHSVGMSQEGAKGMALQGFTYDQILKYYFTGTDIE